jgi:hypothetical protein
MVLLTAALNVCAAVCAAQTPAVARPAGPPVAAAGPSTSAVLQPALEAVHGTLAAVRTDKWKRGSVRDEAGMDIGSINNDMQLNLPPLMRDADVTPGAISKQIAVTRHVDALYDVLLRVVEAARISAPGDQADALQQALVTLSKARLALYDKMQDAAVAQEKQVTDLRATVQKQASFKCPAPPPPEPCPKPVHHTARKKPSAAKTPEKKPAAPATGTAPKTNP